MHVKRENHITCKACKKGIIEGAVKCSECGSFQGGIRWYLDIGNTSLALMVAFISVLALLIPIMDKAFIKSENVQARIISIQGGQSILLFVTNSGEEAAILSPHLTISETRASQDPTRTYAILNKGPVSNTTEITDTNKLIIAPKAIQIFTVVTTGPKVVMGGTPMDHFYPEIRRNKNCQLIFTVFDLKGHERTETLDFHCIITN